MGIWQSTCKRYFSSSRDNEKFECLIKFDKLKIPFPWSNLHSFLTGEMNRSSASVNGRRRPNLTATPPFPGDSPAPTSEAFEKTPGRFDQTSPAPPPLPDTRSEVFVLLYLFLALEFLFPAMDSSLTSLSYILQTKLTQLRIRLLTPSRVSSFEFGF